MEEWCGDVTLVGSWKRGKELGLQEGQEATSLCPGHGRDLQKTGPPGLGEVWTLRLLAELGTLRRFKWLFTSGYGDTVLLSRGLPTTQMHTSRLDEPNQDAGSCFSPGGEQ